MRNHSSDNAIPHIFVSSLMKNKCAKAHFAKYFILMKNALLKKCQFTFSFSVAWATQMNIKWQRLRGNVQIDSQEETSSN